MDNAIDAANSIVGGDSHALHTIQAPSTSISGSTKQNLKKTISQARSAGGGGGGTSTLKSETVSKKAFALQDKVNLFLESSCLCFLLKILFEATENLIAIIDLSCMVAYY